eukprot:CAMPEP_0119521380 /NCGR_PEP_ID=MMETSP1344-20130328/37092_1 /TAXON_ID=236787 /ORGANISM="Florenciella parvula, Strain CCMP2471" /LENGTH=183 /DNA_ID=CAMNT_0007559343 /DNA_START=127 /DNA_END=674 /DNA_ORIENTATION=+
MRRQQSLRSQRIALARQTGETLHTGLTTESSGLLGSIASGATGATSSRPNMHRGPSSRKIQRGRSLKDTSTGDGGGSGGGGGGNGFEMEMRSSPLRRSGNRRSTVASPVNLESGATNKFIVGDRVFAAFKNKINGPFYPARVIADHGKDLYDIKFQFDEGTSLHQPQTMASRMVLKQTTGDGG